MATETKMLKLKGEFDAFRASVQRELVRKESQIYKQVYVEVSKTVQQYCQYYNYTLVMRFSRKSVDESEAPGDIVNGMNRQVVYFQPQDDITDSVLKVLNQRWEKKTGRTTTGPSPRATK